MGNESNNLYEFGKFRFDAKHKILRGDGEIISLPPKSLELLKLLIEKQGEVVSKAEIFDVVWADAFVEEGVLTQNIYTLRQALGTDENGKRLIENLTRRGYRLTVPVRIIESEKTEVKELNHESSTEKVENVEKIEIAQSKTRNWLIVAVAGLLLGVGFFAYQFLSSDKSQEQFHIGELKFKQLTDTGDVSYLTISPDGNSVAYTRGFEIYLRDLKSNVETKLKVENHSKIGCLQFSADSNFIYFGNVFNREEKGSIFRLRRADGTIETVAGNIWSGFSLSPDGTEVAFVRKFPAENKQGLIIKNLVNGTEKVLKTIGLPEEFYWNNYPAWSANGNRIAMIAVNQTEHFSRLLLFDKNGAEQELKPQNFRNIEQVVWEADGNSFIAVANDGNNFQLWRISMTGEPVKRITNDLNSYLGISVSHDRKKMISRQRVYFSNIWVGKKDDLNNLKQLTEGTSRNDGLQGLTWLDEEKIVYTSNDEKIRDWNLWLLNTAEGAKQKLTADSETQNDYPTVAPDKQTIYFASDRNKASRIWRINADGSNPAQVTFGEDETHHFPQISADGKWLYFIIRSRRSSTVGRKSLQENSVQELSGRKNYSAGNFLSLSPDGKFLAFQNVGETSNTKVQLGILSTENPDQIEFKEIEAWRQNISWTTDSRAFDFVTGNVKETGILRQSLEKDSIPAQILNNTQTTIFNFSWSPSGEKLAVSRGQLLRDVVLLTNFD